MLVELTPHVSSFSLNQKEISNLNTFFLSILFLTPFLHLFSAIHRPAPHTHKKNASSHPYTKTANTRATSRKTRQKPRNKPETQIHDKTKGKSEEKISERRKPQKKKKFRGEVASSPPSRPRGGCLAFGLQLVTTMQRPLYNRTRRMPHPQHRQLYL